MSELLRSHIQDFGFKHSEIARRATKLNQATTYRVVEGETRNPSLNSITSIIEAICLTDADAGVLYRKFGVRHAKPRLFVLPDIQIDYDAAKRDAKNYLDSGYIREAAHSVMSMFDLAQNDDQLCEVYEQAGIVYLGLGRWEEAQANFEAADAHLRYDIDSPDTPQDIIDRKHTLMTNIGSLMVKRGNLSWAILFARAIVSHTKVSELNRGWGYLVLGEASLELHNLVGAKKEFEMAMKIFQSIYTEIEQDQTMNMETKQLAIQQAEGNIRWSEIHLLKTKLLLGDLTAGSSLKDLEADWWNVDPEASTMAGLFYAEVLQPSKRRSLLLRDLQARAKRFALGEILQRIATLLSILLLIGAVSPIESSFTEKIDTTRGTLSTLEVTSNSIKGTIRPQSRGNTGKK